MLDGANKWQQFRYITLPMLKPTTFFRVCHGSYQLLPGIRSGYADDKGRTGTFLIRSRTLSVSECIPVLQAWLCMRDRISAVLYRYGCYRV